MEVNTIDFGPLLEILISLLVTVLSVGGLYLVRLLKRKFDIDGLVEDDQVRKYLEMALNNGAKYAKNQLVDADWTRIETKNAAVAAAANYVLPKVPDALARFKIDEKGLREMLEARLLDHDPEPGKWVSDEKRGATDTGS